MRFEAKRPYMERELVMMKLLHPGPDGALYPSSQAAGKARARGGRAARRTAQPDGYFWAFIRSITDCVMSARGLTKLVSRCKIRS